MSATTLTTPDIARTHLRLTDSSWDDFLAQVIPQVDAAIKQFCGQQLIRASYTEYYDGSGGITIRLRQRPVVSVENVWLDTGGFYGQASGAFDSTKLLAAGTDYFLRLDQSDGASRSGLLGRIGAPWPSTIASRIGYLTASSVPSPGSIKVAYTAGYDPIPADLTLAANQVIAGVKRSAKFGPGLVPSSESLQEYSYTLSNLLKMTGEYPEVAQAFSILRRYRALGLSI